MALFSAQLFPTPLPDTLKGSITVPLFIAPTSLDEPETILLEDECRKRIFALWRKGFPPSYHDGIKDKDFFISIKALSNLPLHRQNFAVMLSQVKCKIYTRMVLEQLDQDMQTVFTRLVEHYKTYV
jgi:hypothetical protein